MCIPGIIERNVEDALSYIKYDNMSGTGVRLEFHDMVQFQTDSCLVYKGMITIRAR